MNNKADIVMIRPNDQKAVYGDTYKYIACEPPYWMALAENMSETAVPRLFLSMQKRKISLLKKLQDG